QCARHTGPAAVAVAAFSTAPSGGELRPSRPKGCDRGLQRREIVLDDAVDLRRIYPVVLVRQQVAESCDLPPWDLRTPRLRLVAQCFDGLAEDQQVVKQRVTTEALCRAARRCVRPDRLQRLRDVVQALAVAALQTGRASRIARARTRSFIIRGTDTSTPTPRMSSASCWNPMRSSSVRPGSRSTRKSTSLSGFSSP